MRIHLNSHLCRSIVLLLLVFGVPTNSLAEEKKTPLAEGNVAATEEVKTTFINLYSWATILPKELIDLQTKIPNEKKILSIQDEIPKITKDIETIQWEIISAQTSPDLHLLEVTALQNKVLKIVSRLQSLTKTIDAKISFWSNSRKEWLKKKDQILHINNNEEFSLIIGKEQLQILLDTADKAISLIDKYLKEVLIIGKKIGDLQISVYSIDGALKGLDEEVKTTSVQQTAPSIFSKEFYTRIDLNVFAESYSQTRHFVLDRIKNILEYRYFVLLGCLGFLFSCFFVRKSYAFIRKDSGWLPFTKRPISTTIFMASAANAFVTVLPFKAELPEQWDALLQVITLIAITRLTKHLMKDDDKRRLFNRLSLVTGGGILILLLSLPSILLFLYVFYVSVATFFYYMAKLPATGGKQPHQVWLQRSWGILPAAVIVAGITGYHQLAIMIFSILLPSVISSLGVWVLYRFHIGLIDLSISLIPVSIVKENHIEILGSIRPIIKWLHILILLIIQSVIWDIYPNITSAFSGINHFGFDFGEQHISLHFIFTVALVFYGALIASKAVQAILLKNVLPRYKAEKGVQASVTRLAHYAILTFGFLIMLRVLGFQLKQITLLGGALGIGVGFGLQAIVTNFASGLILLFERPIKVGDTIQIGEEWGEVKSLGLRATVIQTFDNAEIVVPNSDLITGQVTNWTLGDRRVRIKVPVGVAYGTDVSHVMEILIACGKANPMVLSDPRPNALFLAFGASSLDFELRVWIPEFLDKLQVLSDLNQDIEYEFSLAGIEIPFPQSDLHLRTVDDSAAVSLMGEKSNIELPAVTKAEG